MSRLRVALCQLNPVVGDLAGNADKILQAMAEAQGMDADVAVFTELAVTGYPPEDLLLKPGFVADTAEQLHRIAGVTRDMAVVVGFVDQDIDLFNAAAVCHRGEVRGVYHKQVLPNYGVFDEQRYFTPGPPTSTLFNIAGVRVGVSICEDIWDPTGAIAEQGAGGAEVVLNLNASPYYAGRLEERRRLVATRASDASCSLVYVNQVGGQDELVFDGASMVFDASGEQVAQLPQFSEAVELVDLEVVPTYRKRLIDPRGRKPTPPLPLVQVSEAPGHRPASGAGLGGRAEIASRTAALEVLGPDAEIYQALVTGTRDYVEKNGFGDVVVALSGGIDSTLVAAVAVDALGASRVHGVGLPSRYSSDHSLTDAEDLAKRLGIDWRVIPIEPAHAALVEMLASSFDDLPEDLTEENLQSRIRGVVVMALSNKFGWLVLTTGNKSEMAVGYSTLYGDTAGGFAVIKDVPKTTVYRLCRWRNTVSEVIPENVIVKPPSAELRPDQRDDQSLPPYEELDPILEAFVEDDMTATEIIARGGEAAVVRRVVGLVDGAEYKRRQTAPGVRVTPKAFGKDRRMPITNRYR